MRILLLVAAFVLTSWAYPQDNASVDAEGSSEESLYRAEKIEKTPHTSEVSGEKAEKSGEKKESTLSYREMIYANLKEAMNTLKKQENEIVELRQSIQSISKIFSLYSEEKETKPSKDKFVAVFDGGSTGTRINIYQFDEKGLVLKSHFLHRLFPGIHNSKTPENDIKQLLALGKAHLEKKEHRTGYDFPIVFNGTAGLRLIDERKRNSVLEIVKKTIQEETKKKEIEVRVIDGKEEGFYAWAALVFVTQMKEKIGIIDLGGGSAQISFEIDKDMQGAQDGIVHGKNKDVLSRSFLGMGLVAGLENVHKTDKNGVCEWKSASFDINRCKVHIKSAISAMIQERTQGKEVAPGISQVNTMFVSSFIAETLHLLQTPVNPQFKDIKDVVSSICSNNSVMANSNLGKPEQTSNPNVVSKQKKPDCISVLYAVMFMENLGVGLFTPIKNSANIPTDISWSLGRALSLIE
ncbi:ectonucleoside triphosphate diphosphohydrolase 5/6 [Nematocida minor]|uniref:ectonucleoside triphosphate diphosphohydrolase 5/6 n=1 Tax=Nematocida minor TaxID=1912983 RepID=UPI00221E63F0|nr:ectonucleoside triphosphate diphosphohydrolase 5/6 [Nematocida minor]KAI5193282.1 ectonucleoside triphosphate diphosphohydrolase 5/6 [Nematocida minor]